MAATRLSDSQKTELVARFRAGEGSQVLAAAYGCSTATVIRAVRAALEPEEYERLKQQGGRRAATPQSAPPAPPPPAPAPEPPAAVPTAVPPGAAHREEDELEDPSAPPAVLAIEDADDFGADADDDDADADDDSDDADADDLLHGDGDVAAARVVEVRAEVRPLAEATLPTSAYMLVDKTVELQARPLSDFPELGALAAEELQLQALVVYLNPRQAKRQCGRSQRVIKIPDPQVFQRTSRFLVAQGIQRVLIEGSLYSLSGS